MLKPDYTLTSCYGKFSVLTSDIYIKIVYVIVPFQLRTPEKTSVSNVFSKCIIFLRSLTLVRRLTLFSYWKHCLKSIGWSDVVVEKFSAKGGGLSFCVSAYPAKSDQITRIIPADKSTPEFTLVQLRTRSIDQKIGDL